jgi:adenylosuccinate lyase
LLLAELRLVQKELRRLARRHAWTVMMGRTHGMHAEPTTFGLKCLLWLEEFRRQEERLRHARQAVNVGKISGAVGTFAHTGTFIERYVCGKLGLQPARVSNQVLQRDRHAEFLAALANLAASMEKIATEIRHLQRPEVGEAEEPFGKGQKGSSAMPHKRNPVTCEQLCGLARVVRGNLLPALENVALWHERDISHSSAERIILADSCIATDYMLATLRRVLAGLVVRPERMKKNLDLYRGVIYSGKVLLELVQAGLTREDAYASVQAAAMRTLGGGDDYATELLREPAVSKRFDLAKLRAIMDPMSYLDYVPEIFARCGIPIGKRPGKPRR